MAGLGILGGIGEALQSGVGQYDKEREYKRQIALMQMQQQNKKSELGIERAGLLSKNVDYDPTKPEGEQYGLTDVGKQLKDAEATEAQGKAGMYKPMGDDTSRYIGKLTGAMTGDQSIKPPSNMSSEQVKMLGIPAMNTGMARVAVANANLGNKTDQSASAAGQSFEKDPILEMSTKTKNSLDRAQSILNNPNKPVTAADLNLAYNDYINAVDASGQATDGKIHRELPETWETWWNAQKFKIGTPDDIRNDKAGAQQIELLRQNVNQVRGDISSAVSDRASRIGSSYQYVNNPKTKKTVQDKVKQYSSGFGEQGSGLLGSQNQAPPESSDQEDKKAVQWAQTHKNDPRAVKILKLHGM